MQQPFRVNPALPVGAVKTYQILAPPDTHWRPAGCAEVNCPNHLNGWRTVVDEATDLGKQQAHYIRNDKTRKHGERRDQGLTVFEFEAGQTCFTQHRVRVGRQEIYLVKPGDWRGTTGEPRIHTRPEDWVDDFANHQLKIDEIRKRG